MTTVSHFRWLVGVIGLGRQLDNLLSPCLRVRLDRRPSHGTWEQVPFSMKARLSSKPFASEAFNLMSSELLEYLE